MKIFIIIALATTSITLTNAKKVKLEIYEIRERDNDRSDRDDVDDKNVINDRDNRDDRDDIDDRGDRYDRDDEMNDQLVNIRQILQKQAKQDRYQDKYPDRNSLEINNVIKKLLKKQRQTIRPRPKALKSDDSLVNLLKKLVNYLQSDDDRGILDSYSSKPYAKYLDNSGSSYLDQTRGKAPILVLQDDEGDDSDVLDLHRLTKPKRQQLLPLSVLHSLDDDN